MNWREAFLNQAFSDYEIFLHLNRKKPSRCHELHYLQMATEKLAKSLLSTMAGPPPRKSHLAFVRFLKISKGRPEIRRALGYTNNYNAYVTYVDSLIGVAEKVEKLAPSGGGYSTLNPEYPWKDDSGSVVCPCSYAFPEFPSTDLVKLQALLSNLIRVARYLM